MIGKKDQEQLFTLIAQTIKRDVHAYAIGGTAMMFSGYKEATKDIDLVFTDEQSRRAFIKAIESLGYREVPASIIYTKGQLALDKPVVYTRNDERFDLFMGRVFRYVFTDRLRTLITQREDFIGEHRLTLDILPEEHLVILKAVTSREKDEEDILAILKNDHDFDWDLLIDEALKAHSGNSWILIDLEGKLAHLKTKTLIPEQAFKRIYAEQDRLLKKRAKRPPQR